VPSLLLRALARVPAIDVRTTPVLGSNHGSISTTEPPSPRRFHALVGVAIAIVAAAFSLWG